MKPSRATLPRLSSAELRDPLGDTRLRPAPERRGRLATAIGMCVMMTLLTAPLWAQSVRFEGVMSTLAGTGTQGYNGDNIAASSAQLAWPSGVAVDAAGNLYIADASNHRVRRVSPGGVITTVAGTGTNGYNGDNMPATEAQLNLPQGVALDAAGNLYIADDQNHRVRKVSSVDGTITTVAGTGASGYSGDGGSAAFAQLNRPIAVTVDRNGVLYIADDLNYCVRKVVAGNITTAAGVCTQFSSTPSDGPATTTPLNYILGLVTDAAGNLYFSNGDYRIRKVPAGGGLMTTVAGTGIGGSTGDGGPATSARIGSPHGVAMDGGGNLYISEYSTNRIRKVSASDGFITTVVGTGVGGYSGDGAGPTNAQLFEPVGVAVDTGGNLYIADSRNSRVRMVQKSAVNFGSVNVSASVPPTYSLTFSYDAGVSVQGLAVLTQGAPGKDFTEPGGFFFGGGSFTVSVTFSPAVPGPRQGAVVVYDDQAPPHPLFTLYLSGTGIGPAVAFRPGIIATVAGNGLVGYDDGIPATSARLWGPSAVALDGRGNLYLTDEGRPRVQKVDAETGVITTVAGTGTAGYNGDNILATTAQLTHPNGLAVDGAGNVYIADGLDGHRVRKVDASTGFITTVAGTGVWGLSGDGGPATSAQLNWPRGIAVDSGGNLYIADYRNQRVRKVTAATGVITTVAGGGVGTGDGIPATRADLWNPAGVAIDDVGNLYITESTLSQVRRVDGSTGIITTIAGTRQTSGFTGDGGPATSATLGSPYDVKVDAAGNVYIADSINNRVRKVDPSGIITTIAGTGIATYNADLIPATAAQLGSPDSLALDDRGNLYIVDSGNSRIRRVNLADPPLLTFPDMNVGLASPSQDILVDNVGNAPLSMDGLELWGIDSAHFRLLAPPTACSVAAGQVLNPGAGCLLSIEFAPLTTGPKTAAQLIVSDHWENTSTTRTLGLSGTGLPALPVATVTADSKTMTYHGAVPPLTYTPSVALLTPPNCTTTATSASPVGTYPIVCSGASAAGYLIDYVPGTVTINPAPLTIIADNKSMGVGSAVPLLTASYIGPVTGAEVAEINGVLTLTTNATSSSPAGVYDITFTTVPTLTNFTVSTVAGKLTVSADLLNFNNNYFVTGDVSVGNVPLRGTGVGGFASGTINISDISGDSSNGVPKGADIVAALLYWQRVELPNSTPRTDGFFRNFAITGEKLGNDFPYTVTGLGSGAMRVYRANVLAYLPLDKDGRHLAAGHHVVKLPDSGGPIPFTVGATLVVVYRVMSPDFPLKAVVIYDGAWVRTSGFQQMVRGFYDAVPGTYSKTRYLMAKDGYSAVQLASTLMPAPGPVSQVETQFEAVYGDSGSAVVLSVPVNDSDHDGLLDAWEAGPPVGTPHGGEPGYFEVTDGSWVPLTGAINGKSDLFAQYDYMCSAVNPLDGTCAPPAVSRLPDLNTLEMVKQAFHENGIELHYRIGYAIQEETCQDSDNQRCPFIGQDGVTGEPGVVGWKGGFEVLKAWPRDPAACVSHGDCRPRFERGQKDSYHYVLFGDSLAVAAWNTRARTLESIVVSGGQTTITTPHRAPLNGRTCPTRVTISGALSVPALNGVYNVSGCGGSDTTITISTPGVGNWRYDKPALPLDASSPVDEPEPMLAVMSGNVSSISGFSDLGGADSAVTLAKWATAANQDMSKKPEVQAGTLMHELGHTIGLPHGGAYFDTIGSYAPSYGANCKPNYLSIMNYMFQIDLLPGKVLAFSGQALDTMDESAGSVSWTGTPAFQQTSWYVPWQTGDGTGATRHCDGTPILDGAEMVRKATPIAPLTWSPNRDINFDGQSNTDLRGYQDLPNIDLRQVGASGAEYVSMSELLGFGGGGTFNLGSGGTFNMGSGGTFNMGSGGTFNMGSGGTFNTGSGGTFNMGSGGTFNMGSGGTFSLGGGGTFNMGSGGTFSMGSGGTFSLGSGGTFNMGSGGTFDPGIGGTLTGGTWDGQTLTLGSGGTFSLGSGGVFNLGAGGTFNLGSGGTFGLGSGGTFGLGSGGTFGLGSGGTFNMGSGGTFNMGSGGTFNMGSGGTFNMGSGGTFNMGSGGTFGLGSGGTFGLGSGGTFNMGSGGIFGLGSGGTFGLGSGGTYNLGSGGTFGLGSGGTFGLGSGGTFGLGSGGIFGLGSGGVMDEMTYETANAVVRPPTDVTKAVIGEELVIAWEAPFGVVSSYDVYARVNGSDELVGSVLSSGGNPPLTTLRLLGADPNAVYVVRTTVVPDSESTVPRTSAPSEPAKSAQTITFDALPDRSYPTPPFPVTATATPSGLPVSFGAAGKCTVAGNVVSLTGGGFCTITALQPGDAEYNPAPSVSRTFAIAGEKTLGAQTISFGALPNKTYGDADFTVNATASSGLPVSFVGADSCILTGRIVHLTHAGSCTVTASQPGNSAYDPAPLAAQTFEIVQAMPTITWSNPAPIVVGTPLGPTQLSATVAGVPEGSAPGALTYTPAAGTVLAVGVQTLNVTAAPTPDYHEAKKQVTVTVQYGAAGCLGEAGHQILPPINADGTSVFKLRSAVPAKFRVCDATGNSIGTAGVVTGFRLVQTTSGTTIATVNEDVIATTPDTNFRWDPTGQQWVFNISTKNLAINRTYLYEVILNDGTTISFQFGLK